MNPNLVYAKTSLGEEAVRQGTQVVQRNLRMVLLQVDGKLNVTELSDKIGNPRLVESCLKELAEAGLIVGTIEVASFRGAEVSSPPQGFAESVEPRSMFSAFMPNSIPPRSSGEESQLTEFSSFGKPIMPAAGAEPAARQQVPAATSPDLPRRPMGWRKPLLAMGVAALLMIGGVLLFPYQQYKPALEGAAARLLGAPVTVEKVGLVLLPRPQLKLTNVSIGPAGEGRISEIRIDSPLSLLGNKAHAIPRVELSGVELSVRRIMGLPLLSPGGLDAGVTIGKIHLNRLSVSLGQQLSVVGLSGEIAFGPDGRMEKAILETSDRSLLLEARPAAKGLALNVEGRGWQPGGEALALSSLQAKGMLTEDKLLLQNVDTTFLGGLLRGNWLLDWSKGLAMTGEGTLIRLDSRKVTAVFVPALRLEGEMSGTVRVRSAAIDWEGLWKNVEVVIDGEVAQGVLHGVDPFEAARRGRGHEVRAGALRFNRLQYSLAVSPRQMVGRSVSVDAGVANAAGQFTFTPGGQVDAQLNVSFRSTVSSLQMPVRVSGKLPDLVAVSQK